ncbi:MAG: VWA domain-containing protein [Phycisphaeraceae bacterium]|nr:VWA domain-containing protein [Phycisphaeraceae bacterium]
MTQLRLVKPPFEPDDASGPVDTFWTRAGRFIRRASVAGVCLSVLVHIVLWVVAMFITVHRPASAYAAPEGDTFELALATDAVLTELIDASVSFDDPAVPEVPLEDIVAPDLLNTPEPLTSTAPLPDINPADLVSGGGDIGTGFDADAGGAGGGANFFGVEAKGRRFVYIVDVSGSMGFGGRIEALRASLAQSIDALAENAEFIIIAFSDGGYPVGGRAEWTRAAPRDKQRFRGMIAQLQARGGTEPRPAFQMAFALRPRPDAFYFMTDGEFHPDVVMFVNSLNAEVRAPIHCISLGDDSGAPLLRRISQESGGTYTHIPGRGP